MKKTILILLAFSIWLPYSQADNKVETRTASFSFDVSANDLINIQAKYTDLTVEAWDKNEVFVEATIRFDGKMNDRMQRFLDSFEEEVKNNISDNPGELLIKTNLEEPNKFQLGSKNVGIVISFNEDELRLEYKIKVPSSNRMMIKNSYRDLILSGEFDEVDIDQYSGELEAGYIKKADIKLKYGTASFNGIGTAKMELYEQNLTVGKIERLEINTKYSELDIEELGPTEIISYESDFEIGTLELLEGNLKYGKLEVTGKFKEGELETYEFDIEANEIGTLIYENSKYGKLEAESIEKLGLDQSYEDEFDLNMVGSLISEETKYGKYTIGTLKGKIQLSGYEDEVSIDELGPDATSVEIRGKYIDIELTTNSRGFKLVSDTRYGKMDIDRDNMNIRTYIKDGDQLEIDATSKNPGVNPVLINIQGYEIKLNLN
ncbi:MAG: hypothetical protein RIM99_07140 [Cyclobacteriaceae bacterium]